MKFQDQQMVKISRNMLKKLVKVCNRRLTLSTISRMNKIYLNWPILFLFAILTSSCETSTKELLIGTWKVESVTKLSDNSIAPDMGTTFEFDKDTVSMTNNFGTGELPSLWELSNDELLFIDQSDTNSMSIVELSDSLLIWETDLGEGVLQFRLKKSR